MLRSRKFADPEIKKEMLNLRLQGLSYNEISKRYNADYSTIIYHCKEAGLTLKTEVKKQLFGMLIEGSPCDDIVNKLNIPKQVVDFYHTRYRIEGDKLPFVKSQFLKIRAKRERLYEKKKEAESKLLKINKTKRVKIDERGVEWCSDLMGGWICLGKSSKQQQLAILSQKKKDLELKRIKMLIY